MNRTLHRSLRLDRGCLSRIAVSGGSLFICSLVAVILIARSAVAVPVEFSGQYTLSAVVIPVSATLLGGTWIGTPAEFIYPRLGIESSLDLTASTGNWCLHANSAMNFTGFERLILDAGLCVGAITLKPELWWAVPYETVIDDDSIVNSLVIQPGDMLFVKARMSFDFELGGVRFSDLLMIEDVRFPDPADEFTGSTYDVQSQSFHVGNILRLSVEPYPGVLLTSVTNMCAVAGSNDVKGWSASGSVSRAATLCDDSSWFNETISLSGLQYCGIPFWFSLSVDPFTSPILTLSGGGSFSGFGDLELSGGFSFFPLELSGFSFSGTWCDQIQLSVSLTEGFEFSSASMSSTASVQIGTMIGTISSSASYSATSGLTGAGFAASVRQGAFSGGISVAIATESGNLVVSSVSPRLLFIAPPVSVSTTLMFTQSKLSRVVLTVGVIF